MPQFPVFPGEQALFSNQTERRGVLRITGSDRTAFLTRILSGDLPNAPGAARTALLGPKGNLIAAAIATVTAREVLLECERSREQALVATLDRYRIADDVELSLVERGGFGIVCTDGPTAPKGPDPAPPGSVREAGAGYVRRDFRPWRATTAFLPVGGPDRSGSRPAPEAGGDGGVEATAEQQEYLRILAGEPRWDAELDERSLPLQSGLSAHVRLGKGCYIGQEYVARQAHRGRIPRLLRRFDFPEGEVPQNGAEVSFEGRAAGRITSAVRRPEGWNGPAAVALGILSAGVPVGATVNIEGAQTAPVVVG